MSIDTINPLFKIGEIVGTNLAYCEGFDEKYFPAFYPGRLKNLEIIDIGFVPREHIDNPYMSEYLYTCRSKSGREHIINESFLEKKGGLKGKKIYKSMRT